MESRWPVNRSRATDSAETSSEYEHVEVWIPSGSHQIEYSAAGDQWVPRSNILRCSIGDDEDGRLLVEIDDHELHLEEFGRLLATYAGWGMQIAFVPKDEVARCTELNVRTTKSRGEIEK